jgi:CheY-like chemotaxis protein
LIRWSLSERLTQEGYDVVEADTMAAALARHAEGVDLVLLDYKLPDGDGLAVLKEMRAQRRHDRDHCPADPAFPTLTIWACWRTSGDWRPTRRSS